MIYIGKIFRRKLLSDLIMTPFPPNELGLSFGRPFFMGFYAFRWMALLNTHIFPSRVRWLAGASVRMGLSRRLDSRQENLLQPPLSEFSRSNGCLRRRLASLAPTCQLPNSASRGFVMQKPWFFWRWCEGNT